MIHCRQLCFLHHILTLEVTDPVYKMYFELKSFEHEVNWANDVKQLLQKYDLTVDEDELKCMSRDEWKALVKSKVQSVWFTCLVSQCGTMKKTRKLKYHEFSCQEYLTGMTPLDAQIIFRARLGCINCKGNMPSGHPHSNSSCIP